MRHEQVDIASGLMCGRLYIIYVTYAARAGRHSIRVNVWTFVHNIRHICGTSR